MNVKKYVKKPVAIKAIQLDRNTRECLLFMGQEVDLTCQMDRLKWDEYCQYVDNDGLEIHTLEGIMRARQGDYIIKGIRGEFYPCKKEIFEESYILAKENKETMEQLIHPLLTSKYTRVFKGEKNFNAVHNFTVEQAEGEKEVLLNVHFQEGPIKENGVNGVCGEDLIIMVIDRLEGFQNSPFACEENAQALVKLEEALMWLRKRTTGREQRNVEGTHKL